MSKLIEKYFNPNKEIKLLDSEAHKEIALFKFVINFFIQIPDNVKVDFIPRSNSSKSIEILVQKNYLKMWIYRGLINLLRINFLDAFVNADDEYNKEFLEARKLIGKECRKNMSTSFFVDFSGLKLPQMKLNVSRIQEVGIPKVTKNDTINYVGELYPFLYTYTRNLSELDSTNPKENTSQTLEEHRAYSLHNQRVRRVTKAEFNQLRVRNPDPQK